MLKLYLRTDIGIAHNGIISAAKPSKEQEAQKINDTMVFIKAYLNNIYQDWNECFENTAFVTGLSIITDSKLAILDKEDNLTLVGDFKNYDGAQYSNTSYEGVYYKKHSYVPYSYYDAYEDYGYYDSLYNHSYRDYQGYENMKDYDFEEIDEKDEKDDNEVILEDCDLVALSYDTEYMKISNLRTEEGSIFVFDKLENALLEIDAYDAIISKYVDVCVYVQKEQKVY